MSTVQQIPIRPSISTLQPQRVHVFTQGWFTHPKAGAHIDIGYSSVDAVERHVMSCAAVIPAKVAIVPDWYGPSGHPTEDYTQALRKQSELHGTEFSVMIDKGALAGNSFNDLLAFLRKEYFPSPAYSKVGGKFLVWQFGVKGVDFASIEKINPDITIVSENSSAASFAWPNGFAPDSPQAYMGRYLKRTDAFMVPCLWRLFDDHKVAAPTQSVWGAPARYMAAGPTGWDTWNSLVALIKGSGRSFTDIGIATLDDYEEGTRLEPFIMQEYGAMISATGAQLQTQNPRKDVV